jgi:maltose O-acetyltransferase
MPTEWDKMVSGVRYDASDPQLARARAQARAHCFQFNNAAPDNDPVARKALEALIGSQGQRVRIERPFHCDYGINIHLGDDVYINMSCIVLDCATVRIGDRVLIASGVQLVTATHPIDSAERRIGLEFAMPIVVEEDVWIGAGAIVCPGVTIGARSVIGAGSVVVRDVPRDVVAAGNPCRVLRKLC